MPEGLLRSRSKSGIAKLLSLVAAASLAAAMLVPLTEVQEVRAWSTDPVVNTPICAAAGDQESPVVTSDGSGGAIIVWQDLRNGAYDIYAQRVSSSGAPLWSDNGVAICTTALVAMFPDVASDGSGGAIIAWTDVRMDGGSGDLDIYAQRVDSSGAPKWIDGGVPVCDAVNHQMLPSLVADDSGGAIITWTDNRSGNFDIYAQKVSSSGARQWTDGGVAVCDAVNHQELPDLLSDGSGGAIFTWTDGRNGNNDVYAQRVNSSGAPQWIDNGVAVCTAAGNQALPGLVADGSGGAIVAWTDSRNGNSDVYAQRVNSSGAPQWTGGGVALCTSAGNQTVESGVSDGAGGAIVAWTDLAVGNSDVYAQRVSSSGAPLWTVNGVAVGAGTGDQESPTMAEGGSGSTIIAWTDTRSGNSDIYAQRLDASGAHQWAENGVAICNAADEQESAGSVSDGSGGVIMAWMDGRNGDDSDIYAQRVNGDGGLGAPPNQPTNVAPGNGATVVSVTPTLQSSAFDDPDTGDEHSASQWHMTTTAGDYSSPVFDSATDNVDLTQIVAPSGELNGNTTYYWQVRHQDSQGEWSAWSTETSFATRNRAPHPPANTSPASGAAAVSATPTLQSSPFTDPDTGDPQAASQWRITSSAGDYSNPVFDSNTDNVHLAQIGIPSGKLSGNATYYWQVRHQDSQGEWSAWSIETSFTTQNQAPNQPTSASPGIGTTGVSLTPMLQSLAFSDPDTGDTQAASQWRITAAAGDYTTLVFDSGSDSTNLVELTVPSGTLKKNTTYYWQVRHQDNHGDWSAWSEEASFTTQKDSKAWIWIVVGVAAAVVALGGGVGAWLALRGRRSAPSPG